MWRALQKATAVNGDGNDDGSSGGKLHALLQRDVRLAEQWRVFHDEMRNKCADLGVDLAAFAPTNKKKKEKKKEDIQEQEQQRQTTADASQQQQNGDLDQQIDWLELCLYLSHQLHVHTASDRRDTKDILVPLPKKKRELWRRKKEKHVLDFFQACAARCPFTGLEDTKKGDIKWIFIAEFLLFELQEAILAHNMARELPTQGNATSPPAIKGKNQVTQGVSNEDVECLVQDISNMLNDSSENHKLSHTSGSALVETIDTCTRQLQRKLASHTKTHKSRANPEVKYGAKSVGYRSVWGS